MPAALATFRYPAAWSATLAWALSPLGLSSPIDTFTTQQNDNDILSALLRTSLLRSTRAIVPADVLRNISATQQANSLHNVVTLRSAWPRFLRFSLN